MGTSELEHAISEYLACLNKAFEEGKSFLEVQDRSGLRVFLSKKELLSKLVERVEETTEFKRLVNVTAAEHGAIVQDSGDSDIWRPHVENYFRLTGLYQEIFDRKEIPVENVLIQFISAFKTKENIVRHLAPLEFLRFEGGQMDFGSFQIRQFSQADLDNLFRNKVHDVFFEWAYTKSADLTDYWFIYTEEKVKAYEPGSIVIPNEPVRLSYSQHPFPIESALNHLALFDWGTFNFSERPSSELPRKYTEWDMPFLPHVPFVISLSDSLIDRPHSGPDLSKLTTVPFVDPNTGEEIGEIPYSAMSMDMEETEHFRCWMDQMANVLKRLTHYSDQWRFKDVALGFLTKAFVNEMNIEQLLWHVTTIESILGQQVSSGLTKLLLGRTSKVLGRTKDEQKRVRDQLDKLYLYRSDLVHGNVTLSDKEIHYSNLCHARDFARGIVLWMLHYLDYVANEYSGHEKLPTRKDLLSILDMEPASRTNISSVLNVLPVDFPHIRSWMNS